ncbi:MAG: hypothetical protein JW818_05110 [Pirellulales bacterium]|nr:hypothetical protein [Pirellulales bacterium]
MASHEQQKAATASTLGFVTVVEDAEDGLFGGYLVLNLAGRPVEFHCTAPIRPNRAQEILYGPTLQPYLFGEQIGRTLIEKATARPLVVCTDHASMLAVRDVIDLPVALVLGDQNKTESDLSGTINSSGRQWRIDAAHGPEAQQPHFELGRNRLAVSPSAATDRQTILDRLGPVAGSFDLAEPFGRIREAIDEARRGGR